MAEDKMLVKKDLALILKINQKLSYDNISAVQKVHDTLLQKQLFHSSLGKRYINKLERVIQGEDTDKCLFCGKINISKTAICEECLSRFQPAQVKKEQQETAAFPEEKKKSIEMDLEKNKEKIKEVIGNVSKEATTVKKTFQNADIKNKIVKELNSPNAIKAKQKMRDKSKDLFVKIKMFWNKLSKKGKIITVSVICIIGIALFAGGGGGAGTSGGKVSSADEAVKAVESVYPQNEYTIKSMQVLHPAEAMFDVAVGKYCGNDWSGSETIDAYALSVQSKKSPQYSCICYISADGRAVAYGNLVYEADTSAYFRIK